MKFMAVRTFLRGGYREITEPTIITNRQDPLFTVYPAVSDKPGLLVRDWEVDSSSTTISTTSPSIKTFDWNS